MHYNSYVKWKNIGNSISVSETRFEWYDFVGIYLTYYAEDCTCSFISQDTTA